MNKELTPITGNNASEEQAHIYSDIYEAPSHLRVIRSARLSLAQINALVADAYANKLPVEEGIRDTEIPDFGGAKKRFEETHKIEKGFWVTKEEEATE
jgi:hypothetical protein